MRILIVSHPPLQRHYGAAQTALNLADALTDRGHEAVAWSPEPLPATTPWWSHWRAQRTALERHLASEDTFDVIDTPAVSLSPRVAASGFTVARSVQPDLRYMSCSIRGQLKGTRFLTGLWLLTSLHSFQMTVAILRGWQRADRILCLGSAERNWMSRHFPRFRGKIRSYVSALTEEERIALAAVRNSRAIRPNSEGIRFLWLGRWTRHKGPDELLAFIRERMSRHPLDTFTIAGCGEDAVATIRAQLPDTASVRVVPSYSRTELPAILAGHDVGLFTSRVEGWGLSINEMLEAGLPIYAADAGGVADLQSFLPNAIRPFPPPNSPDLLALRDSPASWSAYFAEVNWARIGELYERDVLARVPGNALR